MPSLEEIPYLMGVPGMNYFVLQTSDQEGSLLLRIRICPYFRGILLLPQPVPWIGDYSWLLLTPVTGQLGRQSLSPLPSYDIDKALLLFETLSLRYQIETQLTPTYGFYSFGACQGKALALYLSRRR